jgi:hypothetical protein
MGTFLPMGERKGEADLIYLGAHLADLLARHPRVHEPELDVTVDAKGCVVVTGVVPTAERRIAVGDVMRQACPDHDVDNRTTVADYEPPAREERIT